MKKNTNNIPVYKSVVNALEIKSRSHVFLEALNERRPHLKMFRKLRKWATPPCANCCILLDQSWH
jgi:hypothetical protein